MNQKTLRTNPIRTALAFLMALLMILSALMGTAANVYAKESNDGSLSVAVLSDLHMLAPSLVGNTSDFKNVTTSNRKMFKESAAIIDARLQKIRDEKPDVLLLAGDLTKDGELESHKELAGMLQRFHKQSPKTKIYVTNGNHDINNRFAKNYNTDGKAKAATRTSPQDFENTYSITYKDKSIIARYLPTNGKSGGLSYVARPKPGYTFIVIDSCKYTSDNTSTGKDEHQTGGHLSTDLENWVLKQIASAKNRGDTVIGMEHHNIVPHFSFEPTIRDEFILEDYDRLSTNFADAGMQFIFTGHMHSQDVAKKTTRNGNDFYDIETGACVNYPSPMRYVTFQRSHDRRGRLKETLKGTTFDGGGLTYTDPTICAQATIDNIKSYGEKQIISRKLVRQLARHDLSVNMKAGGKTYTSAEYSDMVNSIMNALMDIKVTADGSKNLYDYCKYAYLHYLAGEDGEKKPDWFKEADKKLSSGSLLQTCVTTIAGQLKGYDDTKSQNIIKYLFLPPKYLSRKGIDSDKFTTLIMQMRNGGTLSSSDLKELNTFYKGLMNSISYDSNFANDKNFTINELELDGQTVKE